MHDAMVGQGERGLAQARRFLDEQLGAPQTVEKRIFRMDVQMHKIVGHDGRACRE